MNKVLMGIILVFLFSNTLNAMTEKEFKKNVHIDDKNKTFGLGIDLSPKVESEQKFTKKLNTYHDYLKAGDIALKEDNYTEAIENYEMAEKNAISNDGSYSKPSSGGNLPVGEVYIAPRKDEVFGKVILDGSIKHRWGTYVVKSPVELDIERGQISEIKGGYEANLLRKSIKWAHNNSKFPWGVRRVGELGIGINPKAKIIGATIVDEKSLGTAHIGIGSNYWFGGSIYSIIHLDQIFRNPRIYVDGTRIKI